MKLYKVEITALPDGARRYHEALDAAFEAIRGGECPATDWAPEAWAPDGWLEDELEREWWIKRHGDTRFFWPSTKRLYQSRSGAEARAALIRSYGATVEVIESDEIVWLTPEMKRERKIAELRAEIARLESPRLTAVAS